MYVSQASNNTFYYAALIPVARVNCFKAAEVLAEVSKQFDQRKYVCLKPIRTEFAMEISAKQCVATQSLKETAELI